MQKFSLRDWAADFLSNPSFKFAQGKMSPGISPRTEMRSLILSLNEGQWEEALKTSSQTAYYPKSFLLQRQQSSSLYSLAFLLYGSLNNSHLIDAVLRDWKGVPPAEAFLQYVFHLVYAMQSPNIDKLQHPPWSFGNKSRLSKWAWAAWLWITEYSGDKRSCQWEGEGGKGVNYLWPPVYKNTHAHRKRIRRVGGWE